ncbi:M48 family metalloprotease [Tundrisphaera sp. TA3]|uniref:M48 family metalloprotease n=1 Tax=Tundrisphaera sp. TA3 TaxID=3435775 RepID=UPI003EB7034B
MSAGYYGDGPRGASAGQLARWAIGLVIALVGVAMYYLRTEVNPVTGEKQHIAMSVDEEKALGLQAAPEMAAQMGGVIDPRDDPRAMMVSEVGRRIVARSDASKSPYVDNFHFHLLDDPKTINAFALPGGQIFITRALYEKLENEAQLAGVLGHEIGHVIERHSAQQMAAGQLGQLLTVAVGVGASGGDDGGRKAQMASAMANQMMQLHYSRGDESQADSFGLKDMAQAGYDPRAMLDVMKVLKAASEGSRQPEFLLTHPLPETRLEAIQQAIDQAYPNGIPAELTKGRPLSGSSAPPQSAEPRRKFDFDRPQ